MADTVTETPAAAEVVIDDANVMQALVNADFELLGTKLVAEYYHGKNSDYFLLMPTDESDTRGITIDEMLTDISTLLGVEKDTINTDELTNSLESLNKDIDINKIKVVLKMAYFYMIVDSNQKKQTEYAFQFEINTSDVLPKNFKAFNIYRVGFAVWNTDRTKIIDRMNLYKVQDILAQ